MPVLSIPVWKLSQKITNADNPQDQLLSCALFGAVHMPNLETSSDMILGSQFGWEDANNTKKQQQQNLKYISHSV